MRINQVFRSEVTVNVRGTDEYITGSKVVGVHFNIGSASRRGLP